MVINLQKLLTLVVVVFLVLLTGSCGNQEPIKVGVSVQLSGKYAQFGMSVRNAVEMAINEINADGGIDGRPLKLIVRDEQQDPEISKKVNAELIEEGVVAIIGQTSSRQTAAVLDQMNEAEVVLLGSVASSAQFSDQKDYYFRVVPATGSSGAALAKHAYDNMGLRQVSGVYDADNEIFTRSFWDAFAAKFQDLGGEVEQEFSFSASNDDLNSVAEEIIATKPEAVAVMASQVDTAFLAQYITNLAEDGAAPVFVSSAAQSEELLTKGGAAVEGMVLLSLYDVNNSTPSYQAFAKAYLEEFGDEPNKFSTYSYEAMQVLAEALKETGGEAEGLPEALLNIKEFPVVQGGNISINEYGDVEREVYITVIEDGAFKIIDTVSGE